MRVFVLTLTMFFILFGHGTALAEGAIDLTGEWQVITSEWRSEKDGFNVDKASSYRFSVTGQKRKIFWGKRSFWDYAAKKTRTLPFSGVVCVTNNSVFLKEHGNGIAHGTLVSEDKMYLYFMEDGENAKIILWEVVRKE